MPRRREGGEVGADLRGDVGRGLDPDRRDRGRADAHHPAQRPGHLPVGGGGAPGRGLPVRVTAVGCAAVPVGRRQRVDPLGNPRPAFTGLFRREVEALHRLPGANMCSPRQVPPGAAATLPAPAPSRLSRSAAGRCGSRPTPTVAGGIRRTVVPAISPMTESRRTSSPPPPSACAERGGSGPRPGGPPGAHRSATGRPRHPGGRRPGGNP